MEKKNVTVTKGQAAAIAVAYIIVFVLFFKWVIAAGIVAVAAGLAIGAYRNLKKGRDERRKRGERLPCND